MSLKAFRTFSNGNKIPWIGFGTGTALYHRSADDSVSAALEAGFIHIDCAEMYGNEASVGQAIKKFLSSPGISRDSLFVTTKLDSLPSGRTVQDSIKESLRQLQIDYLDLYLIHTPVPHQGRLKEVWKQMEEVYREGLAKNIGVSNFRLKDFAEFIDAAEVVPVVNQIEFNPYLLKATEPLLALHKKYSILTVSYGGLVPLSRKTGGPLDDIIPTIRERLSKDTGKQVSDGQVLLKWLNAHDALPITTSSKKDRLVNLLETPDLPDLTAEEVKELDEAGEKIHHRNYVSAFSRMMVRVLYWWYWLS